MADIHTRSVKQLVLDHVRINPIPHRKEKFFLALSTMVTIAGCSRSIGRLFINTSFLSLEVAVDRSLCKGEKCFSYIVP